ncbi:MAG: hypothetical protein AAFY46_14870 [Planctomycetota bacterium]
MTLTLAQYATQYTELEVRVASAVVMPAADQSAMVLYDPSVAIAARTTGDQLGSWSVLAAPPNPLDHFNLARYARALTSQLVGAAKVSHLARIAAAEQGGNPFQSQNVGGSLSTVMTTHVGSDLATREYTVLDPSQPSGGNALLEGFTPAATVAAVIESVRAQLDTAVTKIDEMTAAL